MKIKQTNKILLSGTILGLLSVMMAAYIDHSLSSKLADKSLRSMLTAVKYHQLYAIVITILGLIIPLQANSRMKLWLSRSAYIFIAGSLLFSFSIYLAKMTNIPSLLNFTPIGGITLMIGWCMLIFVALL